MTKVSTQGPWAPVCLTLGGRSFWVVLNRDGAKPAEIEAHARIIAAALNAAMARPAISGD